MGNYLNSSNSKGSTNTGNKRKYEDDTCDTDYDEIEEELLNTPKRYCMHVYAWACDTTGTSNRYFIFTKINKYIVIEFNMQISQKSHDFLRYV